MNEPETTDGGSIASMMRRFRDGKATSRDERNDAKNRGELKEMWFSSASSSLHAPTTKTRNKDGEFLDTLESSLPLRHSSEIASAADLNVSSSSNRHRSLGSKTTPLKNQIRSNYTDDDEILAKIRTAPEVPRFRFVPKSNFGVSRGGANGDNDDSDDDDDAGYSLSSSDSSGDEGWKTNKSERVRHNNEGNFESSMRLATFRGSETNVANRRSHNSSSFENSFDKENSSPNVHNKSSKQKSTNYNYKSNCNQTTAAITCELDGVCESLNKKLGEGGFDSYQSFNPTYEGSGLDEDLPFTIAQVIQNLDNNLYSFNKYWVEGRDVEEEEKEKEKASLREEIEEDIRTEMQLEHAAMAPSAANNKGKKRNSNRNNNNNNNNNNNSNSNKNRASIESNSSLVPVSTELALNSQMSPRARSKALLSMLKGSSSRNESENDNLDNSNSQLTDNEERMLFMRYDERDDEDCDKEDCDSSYYEEDEGQHTDDGEEDEEYDNNNNNNNSNNYNNNSNMNIRSSYDMNNSNRLSLFAGRSMKISKNNKNFYGRSTLLATSDDIVTELEITIKCMQKRFEREGGGDALITEEKKDKTEEEEIDDALEKAGEASGDDGDNDESEGENENKKKKKIGKAKGKGKKEKKITLLDSLNARLSEDVEKDDEANSDDDVDSLDSSVFGGTQFGWFPNSHSGVPQITSDGYVRDAKENEDGTRNDENSNANKIDEALKTNLKVKEPYEAIFADNMIQRGPSSERPQSPRIISTDDIYSKRYRPSSHENQNVKTPVIFVSNNNNNNNNNNSSFDPSAPPLKLPGTVINSWSYVPRHSTEWELKEHPSDAKRHSPRLAKKFNFLDVSDNDTNYNQHGFDSFPSSELANGNFAKSKGDSEKNSKWVGSSLLSARKRLTEFKNHRARLGEESARANGNGNGNENVPPTYNNSNSSSSNSNSNKEDESSAFESARNRLEAFKKLRNEYSAR